MEKTCRSNKSNRALEFLVVENFVHWIMHPDGKCANFSRTIGLSFQPNCVVVLNIKLGQAILSK